MSKILVTRIGAIGDCIIITPALKMLKQDGHHITLETKEAGEQILRHSPYVDKIILHDLPEGVDLDLYWKQLAEPFDKHINLGGSIEDKLQLFSLFHPYPRCLRAGHPFLEKPPPDLGNRLFGLTHLFLEDLC